MTHDGISMKKRSCAVAAALLKVFSTIGAVSFLPCKKLCSILKKCILVASLGSCPTKRDCYLTIFYLITRFDCEMGTLMYNILQIASVANEYITDFRFKVRLQ